MTDSNAGMPWRTRMEVLTRQSNTSSTQRDILEQILLHYPKRLARWIATHCPERLLPNKESAGVLDALDGWNKPEPIGHYSDYFSGIIYAPSVRPTWTLHPGTRITHSHGNNENTPSK